MEYGVEEFVICGYGKGVLALGSFGIDTMYDMLGEREDLFGDKNPQADVCM